MANLFTRLAVVGRVAAQAGIAGLSRLTSNDDVTQDLLPEKTDSIGGTREFFIGLQSKARAGDTQSMFFLAMDYRPGGDLRTDLVKAAKWMGKAAQRGDAVAQAIFAYMYWAGEGVPQNYSEAVRWYHASALQGNSTAAHELSLLYDA